MVTHIEYSTIQRVVHYIVEASFTAVKHLLRQTYCLKHWIFPTIVAFFNLIFNFGKVELIMNHLCRPVIVDQRDFGKVEMLIFIQRKKSFC